MMIIVASAQSKMPIDSISGCHISRMGIIKAARAPEKDHYERIKSKKKKSKRKHNGWTGDYRQFQWGKLLG
jgi:hypothetical protein